MPFAARIIVGTVVTSSSSTTRGLVRAKYAFSLACDADAARFDTALYSDVHCSSCGVGGSGAKAPAEVYGT